MTPREIGATGIRIAPVMLGGNMFGWTADERLSFRILDAFVGSGFNTIDTSDAYSIWVPGHVGGESEAMIGAWFQRRRRRHDIVIATKVGARPVLPGDGSSAEWTPDLSARYIIENVEAALRRLKTDYIDLYQSHVDDRATPIEETLRAYEALIQSGKVRTIGASNFSADRLSASLAQAAGASLPRYASCQSCYNLLDREIEADVQPVCVAGNVGLLCYSALAKGFLSGRYRTQDALERSEWRNYLRGYADRRGFRALEALDKVAQDRGATMAQTAIAWLLARPAVTAAIVGVTSVEQWDEIAPAAGLALTAREIGLLDQAGAS